jgi:plastocyanin
MKRLTILVLFVITALLLSSCALHTGLGSILGGGSKTKSSSSAKDIKTTRTPSANPDALTIAGGKYRPKNLTVKVGTTLTWTNNDTKPESVTSDTPGLFDSGLINTGATWSFTFGNAGTFPYHSTASTSTFGSITVTP